MIDDLGRLLAGIRDERTRRLFADVWQRIPDHDRATVAALVRGVIDSPSLYLRLAQVEAIDERLQVVVNLGGLPHVKDDAAAAAVIVHELAHVVCRHGLTVPMNGLRVLAGAAPSAAEDDAIEAHAEDGAWFVAAFAWGFGAELHAFHEAYPCARRPRWWGKG
jgi:predicted Zn-dependent protease